MISPEEEQRRFLALVFSRRGALLLVAALLFAFSLGLAMDKVRQCDTDSDCALRCPPTDADCDGGPEPVKVSV